LARGGSRWELTDDVDKGAAACCTVKLTPRAIDTTPSLPRASFDDTSPGAHARSGDDDVETARLLLWPSQVVQC